jgi:hypothetical protein
VDRPALTFRCEHVNVIVGVVVGMVVTAKQPIFVGLLLHEVWGLSLHDAIFNDVSRPGWRVRTFPRAAKYLLIFRYYLFSFKFTCSQLDIQYGYTRAVSHRLAGPVAERSHLNVIALLAIPCRSYNELQQVQWFPTRVRHSHLLPHLPFLIASQEE